MTATSTQKDSYRGSTGLCERGILRRTTRGEVVERRRGQTGVWRECQGVGCEGSGTNHVKVVIGLKPGSRNSLSTRTDDSYICTQSVIVTCKKITYKIFRVLLVVNSSMELYRNSVRNV